MSVGIAYDAKRGLLGVINSSWAGGVWVLRFDPAKVESGTSATWSSSTSPITTRIAHIEGWITGTRLGPTSRHPINRQKTARFAVGNGSAGC